MSDAETTDRLRQCQESIGYQFSDLELLRLALTHSSDKTSGGTESMLDNERLEFLGDAVLGMVVCGKLFSKYPDFTEGELTAIKSVVVSRSILAKVSSKMGLPAFMWLGKGLGGHEHLPTSLKANIFEAVVGALYLDGGLEPARSFILEHLSGQMSLVEKNQHQKDFKSLLQHYAQREMSRTPTYRVVAEEGPDHIKQFEVVAVIGKTEYAVGKGKSKKDAEQHAAENTYHMLTQIDSEVNKTDNKTDLSADSDSDSPADDEPNDD